MQTTQTTLLARFALNARYEDLSPETIDQLKRHLLDSLGSFAISRPTIQKLIRQLHVLNGELPALNGASYPAPGLDYTGVDRVAQLFTALTRYLDFMDNFLGKEATCHPSDNIGALLALVPSSPPSFCWMERSILNSCWFAASIRPMCRNCFGK